MPFISVDSVSKEFKTYKREKGVMNSFKALFAPKYEVKKAVSNISFNADKGELVGYIGPNGAGKSTTIKMLCGILVPTTGTISVDGRVPYEDRRKNAMHIGVVFGQRSQLYWDLPMEETFELYKKMYKIEDSKYKRNVEFYIDLLDMQEFLRRPVRQLSLGQKMRANLAIALLHDPDIVYLDEPTIGLDVIAKSRIRHFIKEINRDKKTTVILTTHDMDDIEQICSRLIMIDKGQLIFDGSLDSFKAKYAGGHTLIVDFVNEAAVVVHPKLKVIREEGARKWILFRKEEISVTEAIGFLTQSYAINDLSLKEPDIEDVVRHIYDKNTDDAVAGVPYYKTPD